MLTILCVQVGNYLGRGEEYVRILRDMTARNLAAPHRFVCLSDVPSEIAGVEWIAPAAGVSGWWHKLYLFEHFRDGPYLFMDLDTAIVGPLEPLADYGGPLMMLRDFYRSNGRQSSIMLWSGDHSRIWSEWNDAGRPTEFMYSDTWGDQAWLEIAAPTAGIIQDHLPGRVVSYKRDCTEGDPAKDRIPMGASVVCFHGLPRPHEIAAGWVPEVWRVGGLAQPRWVQQLNTAPSVMLAQADVNLSRDTAMFIGQPAHEGVACIVGGAPSLEDILPNLRLKANQGAHIWALNGTHDWLLQHGFQPHFHVMCDARPENAQFVRHPNPATTYLIGSVCHPDVFDALACSDVVQWVPWVEGIADVAARHEDKPIMVCGGGNTVGLKAMYLAWLWGYRHIRLYGFDSCYRDGRNHAYDQPLNDGERTLIIRAAGRDFFCARWMARQAHDFQKQALKLAQDGCRIEVLGEGLIPHIWRTLQNELRNRPILH